MQPALQSLTPTQPGQRVSPYGGMPQNTPPNAGTAQSQFSTPPNPNQTHPQIPSTTQQNQGGISGTPQMSNFPPGPVAANAGPEAEAREKERLSLLLDINQELLMVAMRIQAAQNAEKQAEKKEESAANTNSPASTENMDKTEQEKADKPKPATSRDYFECVPVIYNCCVNADREADVCAVYNPT